MGNPAAHRVAVLLEFFAEPFLEVGFLERPDGVVPHQRAHDGVGDDEPCQAKPAIACMAK